MITNHRWRILQSLIEYFECLKVSVANGNTYGIEFDEVICGQPLDPWSCPIPALQPQNNVLFYGYGAGARHDENYNKDVAVAGDRIRTSVNEVGEIFIMTPLIILQQRTTQETKERDCKTLLETASNAHNAMEIIVRNSSQIGNCGDSHRTVEVRLAEVRSDPVRLSNDQQSNPFFQINLQFMIDIDHVYPAPGSMLVSPELDKNAVLSTLEQFLRDGDVYAIDEIKKSALITDSILSIFKELLRLPDNPPTDPKIYDAMQEAGVVELIDNDVVLNRFKELLRLRPSTYNSMQEADVVELINDKGVILDRFKELLQASGTYTDTEVGEVQALINNDIVLNRLNIYFKITIM